MRLNRSWFRTGSLDAVAGNDLSRLGRTVGGSPTWPLIGPAVG